MAEEIRQQRHDQTHEEDQHEEERHDDRHDHRHENRKNPKQDIRPERHEQHRRDVLEDRHDEMYHAWCMHHPKEEPQQQRPQTSHSQNYNVDFVEQEIPVTMMSPTMMKKPPPIDTTIKEQIHTPARVEAAKHVDMHRAGFNADRNAFIAPEMGHDRSTQMPDEHWARVIDLLQ